MSRTKSCDPEVPLFLIGKTVAEGVKQRGGKLYRISIVRVHAHQYRIRYTCRVKEARVATPSRAMLAKLDEQDSGSFDGMAGWAGRRGVQATLDRGDGE